MDKGYTPVTAEDYESSMRSTVNAFYEHAVNDPSLTQEEAIAQTAEVAENYLAAMEDVQAAGERGEIATGNEMGAEEDTGIGGEEGGIAEDDGGLE